jgi:hypothetical protein
MNRTTTPLSVYLRQMVKDNYLLTEEARVAARLPKELQEQAVELSETLRVQNMEHIVSDLLNPKPAPAAPRPLAIGERGACPTPLGAGAPLPDPPPPAAHRKPSFIGGMVSTLCFVLIISILVSGVRNVAGALWDVAGDVCAIGEDLILSEVRWFRQADAPVWSPLPAPIITEAWYVPGHKVLLRWKSVGQNCTYRIYRTYGKRRDVPLNEMGLYNDGLWRATSAIVGAGFDGEKDTLFGVIAVSADGRSESPLSNRITVELNPRYREDSLEAAPPSTTPQRQHAWNGV